jgi:hypothetical protein
MVFPPDLFVLQSHHRHPLALALPTQSATTRRNAETGFRFSLLYIWIWSLNYRPFELPKQEL